MRKYKSAYMKTYIRRLTKKDIRRVRQCKGISKENVNILLGKLKNRKYVVVYRGSNCLNILNSAESKQYLKKEHSLLSSNKNWNKWCNRSKKYLQATIKDKLKNNMEY